MTRIFENRADAGRQLAERLTHLADQDPVVLALPRGGVPVGYEVARRLGAPLDVFVVRKLGVPGREELAMGAIASCDSRVVEEDVVRRLRIPHEWIDHVAAREAMELRRRERLYRGDRPLPPLKGRTAIVVDDGLATGATMRAAARGVRRLGPRWLVAAAPVGAPDSCAAVAREVDELVCLERPAYLMGISRWYLDFPQTTDEEVRLLLSRASKGADRAHP